MILPTYFPYIYTTKNIGTHYEGMLARTVHFGYIRYYTTVHIYLK